MKQSLRLSFCYQLLAVARNDAFSCGCEERGLFLRLRGTMRFLAVAGNGDGFSGNCVSPEFNLLAHFDV